MELSTKKVLSPRGLVTFLLQETNVTALHIASKCGLIEIVRCLLLSGACPTTPNKDGVSPEIMALAEGFTSIAELLNKMKGVSACKSMGESFQDYT